ncbi:MULTISPECIES: hypothetical protein [unclassified Xanthobacter]|uniref:hypothetical protein n=1 Tax=unclassified Xanthobacter TaxID=2623496 RepID=UPI001F16ED75|nr:MULTISPECIES: hypothetical protein [unclassified Xanthobacter]
MLRYTLSLITWLALGQSLAHSAEFKLINEIKTGNWAATLYNNINGDRLFCAIESNTGGTTFRINNYIENNDTFLEVFNPDWRNESRNMSFGLLFTPYSSASGSTPKPITMILKGKSLSDSYIYDFDGKYEISDIASYMKVGKFVSVFDPAGKHIVSFNLNGADDAINNFFDCVTSAKIKNNISNNTSFKLSDGDIGPDEIQRFSSRYMKNLSDDGLNDRDIANQLASSIIWLEKINLTCTSYFQINLRELRLHYKLYQGTWQLMFGSGRSATDALNRASIRRNNEFNNAPSKRKWCEDTKEFVVKKLGWDYLFEQ